MGWDQLSSSDYLGQVWVTSSEFPAGSSGGWLGYDGSAKMFYLHYCSISFSRRLSFFVVIEIVDQPDSRGEHRHERPVLAQTHLVKYCFCYVLIAISSYSVGPDFKNGGFNFSC